MRRHTDETNHLYVFFDTVSLLSKGIKDSRKSKKDFSLKDMGRLPLYEVAIRK